MQNSLLPEPASSYQIKVRVFAQASYLGGGSRKNQKRQQGRESREQYICL
jgi:hypothetical protein